MKKSDPHAPNSLTSYLRIHETVMDQYKSKDFVGKDSIQCVPLIPDRYKLFGEISCKGNILITVEKRLNVVVNSPQDPIVQTYCYAYNASVRNFHNIIRYDNQDQVFGFRAGHQDPHHVHEFDWRTGQEKRGSPFWVGRSKWITLGEFIGKVENWYWSNFCDLPNPYDYPELGLRASPPSLEL